MMQADELEIRRLIAAWISATQDGDVDTVLSLMAPDVVFLVAGQPPMAGRDAFATKLRALLGGHTISAHSEVDEVLVDGDMAYSRTTLAVTVKQKNGGGASGGGMTRRGATLSIWRRLGGQWQLTRDANLLGGPA